MKKILLIEPDRLLGKTYKRALENSGYEVSWCLNGQAGVLAADEVNPDLVVLEMQLPAHSGIEFLYEFRSYPDWQDIPVIINSMVSVKLERFNNESLKISVYLYKPVTNLRQLVSSIRKLEAAEL